MSRRGRFITLEGVDGAGKSTHVDFIADAVRSAGHHVIVSREPGGTELAEHLRTAVLSQPMDVLTETLVVFAARADHVARVIRPALESGSWVVCDRFTDATVAYQGAGNGAPAELIQRLADAVHPGLRPDRTLIFDCSYEVARQRLQGKALDRFEREDRAFFERVQGAYRSIAAAEADRVRLINAEVDVAGVRSAITQALAGL